ncbi:HD-GYP domain-containing protein [Limisalsivibrio acetivorans]|uniref:HD-GYP domain-containing protein n=1 Tax=Limisalsivibrio acetivorans TaxID=1304888 RepID=UPI0003B39EF3|nr:HD-GYP domain-containing protein [Limisalsivibrio acetivorans]
MLKVKTKDLKLGDKVLKLDRNWLQTSILKHKFIIKEQGVIDRLIREGVEHVYIEKRTAEEQAAQAILAGDEEAILEVQEEIVKDNYVDLDNFDSAVGLYKESVRIVKHVMSDIRAGKLFDKGALNNVADKIVDITLKSQGVLSSVSKLKQFDEYTFQHSMNVSVFATSLGRHMGLDEEELRALSSGGLMHDVGKMMVPPDILNKPGKLTDEEFVTMKKHVEYGYEYLKKNGVDERMLALAHEHHERFDGSGYPRKLKDGEISMHGKIGAVVDIYDAITSDRVYHKGMEPAQALKLMFKWADSHINKKVFEFFVTNIGIYPVGTLVLLNTNELAMVGRVNTRKPTEPNVIVFKDGRGNDKTPFIVDLAKPVVNKRKIVGPVNPAEIIVPEAIYNAVDKMNALNP